ncbi:NADH flavin oxidoreductase/12-oxophytodienoate reductase [Cucurbitaria berberidis CBS 394.84]|uniref:NADH flavin oxidoreductase/12-oxophytodienoate reductase n=1 Tax=Cucurbitaria berberidis CBS 394.84 TaxID=1168544 RepID=A0A9P4GJJ8_9PLEO|nr:NADH flavin oxidoreductase/12-oxophytodienoate reductase [Cucurbitaria berberidis CBS 394.84]KAF1846384.1 NADH flavin oxidoreductase/12-oxophytodienoate reductase [Cucurbitaria berberidis CBS 394.84]
MEIPPTPKLFQPLQIGNVTLRHRIVMAPMARFRANDDHVPLPFVKDYYAQRASVPGTLLITESTVASPDAVGFPNMPGIWSDAQVAAWREIVDAVHAKGSFIICQLVHLGRTASAEVLEQRGLDVVGPSAIPKDSASAMPRELSDSDIRRIIASFVVAARNAVEKAGFDGVEIHGANGYLVDQFTQDLSNQRSDTWGGSIENRSRFALETVRAVADAVGEKRVGMRLSPWSVYQSMRMADPIPQFTYLIKALGELGLAYLHLIEPWVVGDSDVEIDDNNKIASRHRKEDSNVPLVEAWNTPRPVLLAGGFSTTTAHSAVEKTYANRNVAIVFGRYFTSNPDLVFRIKKGIAFAPYERAGFYDMGNPKGYVSYRFSDEFQREIDGGHA